MKLRLQLSFALVLLTFATAFAQTYTSLLADASAQYNAKHYLKPGRIYTTASQKSAFPKEINPTYQAAKNAIKNGSKPGTK
jgi:hypothetical protein